MSLSKSIIHRAIRLMHASQFAICHLAPHIFQCAQMFQAQQASTKGSSRSARPRAMSSVLQALLSTRLYVKDKIIMEFPKFVWFFQP